MTLITLFFLLELDRRRAVGEVLVGVRTLGLCFVDLADVGVGVFADRVLAELSERFDGSVSRVVRWDVRDDAFLC